MKDDFTSRLLDAGLKECSRVSPPEDFAARVLANRTAIRPAPLAWLGWLAIPAAAALACAVVIVMHTNAPVSAPACYRAEMPAAHAERVVAVKRPSRVPFKPPFHTLTAVELASMNLPPELFATREEKPVADIAIPELTVTPLEIPSIPNPEGAPQP